MAKAERNLREVMSSLGFWLLLAYLMLAAVVVSLFVLFGRTAREEAQRTASARAAATTQVGQCFTSVKTAPVLDGFIDSHEAIIDNSLAANRAAILASPGDPLNSVRRKSIVRLEAAQKNVMQLRTLIVAGTPTEKKCVDLARMLGVDASRYTNPQKAGGTP